MARLLIIEYDYDIIQDQMTPVVRDLSLVHPLPQTNFRLIRGNEHAGNTRSVDGDDEAS